VIRFLLKNRSKAGRNLIMPQDNQARLSLVSQCRPKKRRTSSKL